MRIAGQLPAGATTSRPGGGPSDNPRPNTAAGWHTPARWAASLLVTVTTGFFLWSVVATSSARVSATTENSGLISSGTVNLTAEVSSADVLFDVDGLYPGMVVDGCVDMAYAGSIPGEVRLFGQATSSTGLDAYVELQLYLLPAGATCADASALGSGSTIFDGTLKTFWQRHGAWGGGLILDSGVTADSTLSVLAVVELQDDNRAQGLGVDFVMTTEVRPL